MTTCERCEQKIIELEERVAFAERARDNAIALRDEAKAMAKEKGIRAGEEIARLKQELAALRAEKLADTRALVDAHLERIDAAIAHAAKGAP